MPDQIPPPPSETTAQLWTAFGADLRRSLARRAGPRLDADELVQETFLRAHRSLDQLRDAERAGPWLARIARSVLVDELRRVDARPVAMEGCRAEGDDSIEGLVDADDQAQVERDVAQALMNFLPALESEDEELIRAADIEGVPRRELAEERGLSLTALKSRLARARERLARALDACCRVELDRRGGVAGLIPRSEQRCEDDPSSEECSEC